MSERTKSEGTFKAQIVDYEVLDSNWERDYRIVAVDQNGQEINFVRNLPKKYKVVVNIKDLKTLIPPAATGLEVKEKDSFSIWLFPSEVQDLIQCNAADGYIIFDAGITYHRGILALARVQEFKF